LTDIGKVVEEHRKQAIKITIVLERQSLGDEAMAALFKINKIQCAMELQDEEVKKGVFLMGLGGEKTSKPKTTAPL